MKHSGSCHCGAVSFRVEAPEVLEVLRCNCSICSMAGFIHLIVRAENFDLLSGADHLTSYRFNSGVANHTFCRTCGIKAFYTPRSHPDGYSVNMNCLDKSTIRDVIITDFDGENWEDNIDSLSGAGQD